MMAYANIDELCQYLEITTASDNVVLEAMLTESQAIVENMTGKTFEATADTTVSFDAMLDVDGAVLTWAPYNLWLASITTVTNGDSTAVTSGQYVTEPRQSPPYYALKLLDSSGVAWEPASNGDTENAISIAGRWAYQETAGKVPDDIRAATIRLAAWRYRQRDNVDMDRALAITGGIVLPSQLPADVRDILQPYMRRL